MNCFSKLLSEKNKPHTINRIAAFLVLLAITLAMFGDVLFVNNGRLLSKEGLDLFSGEMYGREFEFREAKEGNFPLWNPHVNSGMPFFDGIASNILYPPNIIHLFLPLSQAINISIALHVLLIGFFMYLWTENRQLHILACIFSSVTTMFSGAYYLHIYAGHLANLCAMTWVPLIFLSIDGLFKRLSPGWIMLGIFAVSMQILASQLQYVYFTALTVSIYCGLLMIKATDRISIIWRLMIIPLGSLMITFVQIFSGIRSAADGARSLGTPFSFASMFSFPPENLIMFFSPFFFGDMESLAYWGRCYLWEMCLFIGISGFFMAVYGACYGEKSTRQYSITMAIILLIMAMGVHTPLYYFLYHYLPGFNKFRGSSKFIFQSTLFLAMLAGIGVDVLLKHREVIKKFYIAPLAVGSAILLLVFFINTSLSTEMSSFSWQSLMKAISETNESYLPKQLFMNASFIHQAGQFAKTNLLLAALLCLSLAFLFYISKRSEKAPYLIVALALLEMFAFAYLTRATFDIRLTMMEDFKAFYARHPGDYRVLNMINHNNACSTGGYDIWGYGPTTSLRYLQFMAFTQGKNPDSASTYLRFERLHKLYGMLRLRFLFYPENNRIMIHELKDFMPRLNLIQNYQLITGRDRIFHELNQNNFNPRYTVILETSPDPMPDKSAKPGGVIELIDKSTDHLNIKVSTDTASILLITDSYNRDWRAIAHPESIQQQYQIMPANYVLMAIPLVAGRHVLRMEYSPIAYRIGKYVSLISVTCYLILLIYFIKRKVADYCPSQIF
jgi:hypothetical protein